MTAPSTTLDYLIAVSLALVTGTATAAALTRDPVRQAAVLSALGLCLSLLFLFLQAPDVALSQLAVGGAVTPLLVLLTVRKIRRTPLPAPAREADAPSGPRPGAGGRGSGGTRRGEARPGGGRPDEDGFDEGNGERGEGP